MGYKHYWTINEPLPPVAFAQYVNEVKAAAAASRILIVGWNGKRGSIAEFDPDSINFNGCEECSHENFAIDTHFDGLGSTKTNRKPYDEIVTAALILLAARFPSVEVKSDGGRDEWLDGLRLARTVNPGVDIPRSVG